jgi:hypothetical protein
MYEAKGKKECSAFTPLQVEETLYQFFNGDAGLASSFQKIVRDFERAFLTQTAFRFFTSSVLLVYDGSRPSSTARLAMVDFAYTYRNVELRAAQDEDADHERDNGYLLGVESLGCMLEHVLHKALSQVF